MCRVSFIQTASFWLTFYALSALWTVPFSGLNIIGLIIYWIKSKIAATEKARARCWQDQKVSYGANVSSSIPSTTSIKTHHMHTGRTLRGPIQVHGDHFP